MKAPAAGDATLFALCIAEWRKIRGRGLLYAVLLFGACHGLLAAGAVKAMAARWGGDDSCLRIRLSGLCAVDNDSRGT